MEQKKINKLLIGIILLLCIVIVGLSVKMIQQKSQKNPGSNGDEKNISGGTNDAVDGDFQDTSKEETSAKEETSKDAGTSEEKASEDNVKKDDFYATIDIGGTWENGSLTSATENVTIYNTTGSNAATWSLDIIFPEKPETVELWNGTYEISDNTLKVKPETYNAEITSNANVTFGYNISSKNPKPESYVLHIGDKDYEGSFSGTDTVSTKDTTKEEKTEASVEDKEKTTEKEKADKEDVPENGTPFENHGKLSVSQTGIVDKNKQAYQLKGCSTHGLTWFPDYVNEDAYKIFRDDWHANLIRLAMYVDTGDSYGYASGGNKEEIEALLDKGVQAASELGMYVIIDWHILSDGDPNIHIEDAKDFFERITEKYKEYDNVIYEICNEPNGGVDWSQVKSYAETIIPIIRENAPDNIIIVGTTTWSQDVDKATEDPITGYDNIMYAVHFYAATHKEDLRNKVKTALDAGLPVFVSEFSICDASGNGALDYSQADAWFDLIETENLSYAAWNISNKAESSALIKSSCTKTSGFTDEDWSDAAVYIRDKMR